MQIILNAFRLKPLDRVLPAAREAGVGIIARVPLASGLLSGRYTEQTTFAADDHRTYNRHGEAFDVGETFSGVDFDEGVKAAREFAELVPEGVTPAQAAIAWIVAQDGVTTVIPGARYAGAGARERRRGLRPPPRGLRRRRPPHLRRPLPRRRPPPLVTRPARPLPLTSAEVHVVAAIRRNSDHNVHFDTDSAGAEEATDPER